MKQTRKSTAEKVTQVVIDALEKGTVPWRRPWQMMGKPRNFVTDKPYRGINWFITTLAGHADPRYMTYLQAKERGWQVRKGEHGTPIVYYNFFESKTEVDKHGKPRRIPFLRHSTVFNVSQIDGDIPSLNVNGNEASRVPIDCYEAVVNNMPNCPTIAWDKA